MAAKLPAAATTASSRSGASRRASRTVAAASPPPIAISGASGPTTAPKPMLTTCGERDAEQRHGSGWAAPGMEAVERRLARRWPGTNRISEADQQAGHAEQRKGPPRRNGVERQGPRAGRRRASPRGRR